MLFRSELLTERTPVYEHVADFIIDTDEKNAEDVAREVIARVESL